MNYNLNKVNQLEEKKNKSWYNNTQTYQQLQTDTLV